MQAKQDHPAQSGWLRLFCFLGILTVGALAIYPLLTIPAEDAIILQQYSRNLAETGVISYIHNGPRAEGATDFLWMLYLAAGMKLHLSAALLSAIADIASIFGMAFLFMRLAGRRFSWIVAFAIAGILGLMPQMQAALGGFSVFPFAFAIVLTFYFLEEGRDVAGALCALLLCLLRPDGVVFAVPLLARSLYLAPSWQRFFKYVAVYVIPGIAYFLWRWHYFHHFLPLPFLVKSDTHRVMKLFVPSSAMIAPSLLFALIVIWCAAGRRIFERAQGSLLIALVIVPTLFYSAMRLDQNVGFRFFIYLPAVALVFVALNWDSLFLPLPRIRLAALAAFAVLLAIFSLDGLRVIVRLPAEWNRRAALAKEISAPGLHGTMLVSEAGLLPYYSEWPAYDSWGLNTPEFASHLVQPADVVRLAPDVVMLHPLTPHPTCAAQASAPRTQRTWDNMVANLQSGVALAADYTTWRVPYLTPNARVGFLHLKTAPDQSYCWYVSNNYRGREQLESALRQFGATEVQPVQAAAYRPAQP